MISSVANDSQFVRRTEFQPAGRCLQGMQRSQPRSQSTLLQWCLLPRLHPHFDWYWSFLCIHSVSECVFHLANGLCFYELTGIHSVVSAGELPQRRRGGRDDSATASKTPAQIAAEQARVQDEADKADQLFSSIVACDPQWLFVIDRNSAFNDRENSSEVLSKNPIVAESNAMKTGRVVHLDGVGWYLIGGGPSSSKARLRKLSRRWIR